jgi:hypothetical protein
LYHSPDLENATFTTTVKDSEKGRWSMNDEFQEGLEAIFKIIRQQIGSQAGK